MWIVPVSGAATTSTAVAVTATSAMEPTATGRVGNGVHVLPPSTVIDTDLPFDSQPSPDGDRSTVSWLLVGLDDGVEDESTGPPALWVPQPVRTTAEIVPSAPTRLASAPNLTAICGRPVSGAGNTQRISRLGGGGRRGHRAETQQRPDEGQPGRPSAPDRQQRLRGGTLAPA